MLARPSSGARWFEPMHVREPTRVRDEMVAQVIAGADFLVAPTWLTHRRALVPIGETRRAREWTELAVNVARESAQIGRERQGHGHLARVLGVLPDPEAIHDVGTGRLPSADMAAERDERDHAGLLADSGVAGVLVESRPTLERARTATRAVVETDLPVWVVIPPTRADALPLRAWLDALAADGATMLLLETMAGGGGEPGGARRGEEPPEAHFGVMAPGPLAVPDPRGVAAGWLDLGAHVLGIEADATADALLPVAEARDAAVAAARERDAVIQADIDAWVTDVVGRAPAGRALWIGDRPATLPTRPEWTVVAGTTIGTLPGGAWRLLISADTLDPRQAARLVERGGIIAGSTADPDALLPRARAAGIRLVDVSQHAGGVTRYVGRRED